MEWSRGPDVRPAGGEDYYGLGGALDVPATCARLENVYPVPIMATEAVVEIAIFPMSDRKRRDRGYDALKGRLECLEDFDSGED